MHSRRRPVVNTFVYPTFFLCLPLSRLEAASNRWFGVNRFNLLAVHAKDHGARDGTALEPWVRALLARFGVTAADGEVVLHCYPRLFGYAFNPVAFWYCHDRQGALRAVIAEVNNTFGERHNYLVCHPDQRPITAEDVLSTEKVFHVSPFCEIKGHYRFRFAGGADRQLVHIDYHDHEGLLLVTSVFGRARPLTAAEVLRTVAGQPLMTLLVILRIHWQAARLFIRRVRFISKPPLPLHETTR
jgi:hypothetical protein